MQGAAGVQCLLSGMGAHLKHFCHPYCQNSSKGKETGRTLSFPERWLLKLLNIPAAGKVFLSAASSCVGVATAASTPAKLFFYIFQAIFGMPKSAGKVFLSAAPSCVGVATAASTCCYRCISSPECIFCLTCPYCLQMLVRFPILPANA